MDCNPQLGCLNMDELHLPCATMSCAEFGDDPISRAADICNRHQSINGGFIITIPPPRIPRFMKGWEACSKVWSAWLESEDGRKRREAEKAEADDLDFVNNIADGLR